MNQMGSKARHRIWLVLILLVVAAIACSCGSPTATVSQDSLQVKAWTFDSTADGSVSIEGWVTSEGMLVSKGADSFTVEGFLGRGSYFSLHERAGSGRAFFSGNIILAVQVDNDPVVYFKYENDRLWMSIPSK